MIIFPSLPSGHTIFCDDIRQEITGKITLVGTYGSHMYLGNFPAIIPRICCVVTYREAPDSIGKVALRVLHETDSGEAVVGEVEYEIAPAEVPEPNPDEPFMMREGKFFFEISPLPIGGPGRLKVRAFRDGSEVRLGALIIDAAPAPQDLDKQEGPVAS